MPNNARLATLFRAIANELDGPEYPGDAVPISDAVAYAAKVLAQRNGKDPESMLVAILEAADRAA